jgi:hypothetical protein
MTFGDVVAGSTCWTNGFATAFHIVHLLVIMRSGALKNVSFPRPLDTPCRGMGVKLQVALVAVPPTPQERFHLPPWVPRSKGIHTLAAER